MQIGVEPIAQCSPDVDETALVDEAPDSLVERLARSKALAAGKQTIANRQQDPAAVVLAGDTVVVLDEQVLGKPGSQDEFLHTFVRLAAREHKVLSGVAVSASHGALLSAVVETRVRMGPITRNQALAYWDTGEPADKAGGYGIQGVGARFVESIAGSYSNVVGLPLYETAGLLTEVGVLRF